MKQTTAGAFAAVLSLCLAGTAPTAAQSAGADMRTEIYKSLTASP